MGKFSEIEKNFGFGCMRLPLKEGKVDEVEFSKMVDCFLANGFNYFDTAHGYLSGMSEKAIKTCLTSRYPRSRYLLTDKLTGEYFNSQDDIRPFFKQQLSCCGVDYFDFYLMHAQTAPLFEKFKKCRAYETALELKKEGKIKHFGISFHDKAEVLERILAEYPEIEVVQIQFNYLDYEDPAIQSKKCYEILKKRGIPAFIMEPVKGGTLVDLPSEAKAVFDELKGSSYASYALRFAAGFENVACVLSGMSNMQMMQDNISFMKDFHPLNEKEMAAIKRVVQIIKSQDLIPCTACHYCTDGCPKRIPIPDVFACYNALKRSESWNPVFYYDISTKGKGKAKDCIKCGKCESVCPQHIQIREFLSRAKEEFDK